MFYCYYASRTVTLYYSLFSHYIVTYVDNVQQLQVLGGIDGRRVLVTLGQGSVFGEIALLGVGGMNRRTADVVSRGFSNLFVLQKDDLETVLKDYPDAKRILNARARRLMKENEERFAKEVYEQKLQEGNPIWPSCENFVHN